MANDRITQLPVEVVTQVTSSTGRITAIPVETVVQVTSANARTTQLVVEVVIIPPSIPSKPQVQVFESSPLTFFG